MKRHKYSSEESWQSEWLNTVPENYFEVFGEYLADVHFPAEGFRVDPALDWCRREFDIQLFVRMQQAELVFVPWLLEAIDLEGKRVLEIGCGTGSSTVPIARRAGSVVACDISSDSVKTNRLRADLMGVQNVNYELFSGDWLSEPTVKWPAPPEQFDVVVCYALIEHLLVNERLNFLTDLWARLKPGGVLVVYETPNRLFPLDWHSSGCLFAQVLPDDLTALYYSRSVMTQ
jgi:2-polyprenyl-3-methyl-5-hydroxy-6-metoxy-1,4-benzoquinol methylase